MKIAFIDHHLENFHANTFLGLLRGPLSKEGATVSAAWEMAEGGAEWCARNDVFHAESIEQAVQLADAVMILAPDNIARHRELAQQVLKLGKPTFIDKMLATTSTDARHIVQVARQYGTPIFSSSSLWYAKELQALMPKLQSEDISDAFVRGINDWNNYAVHTLAIALRVMGPNVKRVIDTGKTDARTVTLDYGDGKRAVVDVRRAENESEYFGWSFAARQGNAYVGAEITDHGAFYGNLMAQVLQFFRTRQTDMPIEAAVATVAVIEAANASLSRGGEWVTL